MADGDHPMQFHEPRWMGLSDKLLDRLRGKMTLILEPGERRAIIGETLDNIAGEIGEELRDQLADERLRQAFLDHFLSYEMIEDFLKDSLVEDIMINATDPIFVHKTGEGLVKTDKRFVSIRDLDLFVKKLVVFGGRPDLELLNNIELSDVRGRVNIAWSPFGPQITITRAKERPLSILELIERGMFTYELAGLLWLYIEGMSVRPANLLVAGEPGSGKTTFMNAMMSFIPQTHRTVVIEDTLELNTGCLANCSRLETYGPMTMADLVKNSLRMRPDRVIIGEVRGAEAQDLMMAINIGKYCMGTLHAPNARETVIRLQTEPMNVPETLVNLVDVFIILKRLNLWGKITRVVGEIVETSGMENRVVLLSPVWSFDETRRRAVESSPSSVYRDRLAQASGLSSNQIMLETIRRSNVLRLMHTKLNLKTVEDITQFCHRYVIQQDQALKQLGVTMRELEIKRPLDGPAAGLKKR